MSGPLDYRAVILLSLLVCFNEVSKKLLVYMF